jgi:ABC-type transport system substrate-binding protein
VQWSLGSYALPPDELEELQPFDLAEARALVNAVGGIRFKMMYPASAPVLEHEQHLGVFVEQMRLAGIEIDQDPQSFGAWVSNLKDVNYDCTLNLNQQYETPEIPLAIHTASGPFGDGTYLRGLGDPEIEEAVRKTALALDTQTRVALVHAAQRVIYEKDPVSLPLATPYLHVAWRKNVKNIPSGIGTSSFLINTMWMDGQR